MIIKQDKLLRELFVEAAEIGDEDARDAHLEKACGGDAELRKRVEVLLAIEAGSEPPPEAFSPELPEPILGTCIGPYTLQE
jgi:hypothetical protein